MFDLLFVTNRALSKEDFLSRIEKIAAEKPKGIILREKDLPEQEYRELARSVLEICKRQDTLLILHNFANVARELKAQAVHLPLPQLRALSSAEKAYFSTLGASCHSVEDAIEAEKLGCSYITAGHIFATDCKKGVPARGLSFLEEVCKSVSIPVYAIGGICAENLKDVRHAGARGACIMSGGMTCQAPSEYIQNLKSRI